MMRETMRRPALLAAILLAPLAAGCLQPDGPEDPAPGPDRLDCDPCDRLLAAGRSTVFEPHAAVDPDDPDHYVVLFKDGSSFTLQETHDGGATWSQRVLPLGEDAPAGDPLASWNTVGDPVVAIADGGVHVGGLGYDFERVGATYVRDAASLFFARPDGGGWRSTIVAQGQGRLVGVDANAPASGFTPDWTNQDKPWFDGGPDGWTTVWVNLSPLLNAPATEVQEGDVVANHLLLSRSPDGLAWTDPLVLDVGQPSSAVVLSESGGALVGFGRFDAAEVTVAWVTDRVEHATRFAGLGQVDLARVGDGYALATLTPADGDHVPTVRTSPDGRTWSDPVRLDDRHAAHVNLAGTPEGRLWASWYRIEGDAREYVVATRPPGGDWSEPLVLRGGIPPAAYGDYVVTLEARGDAAYAAWVDVVERQRVLRFAHVTA